MNDMKVGDIWYRFDFDKINYSNGTSTVELVERRFVVVKLTKCGGWIVETREGDVRRDGEIGVLIGDSYYNQKPRFVMTKNRKSYAHPTLDRAKKAYLYRKAKQLYILQGQLDAVNKALEMAKKSWNMNVSPYRIGRFTEIDY